MKFTLTLFVFIFFGGIGFSQTPGNCLHFDGVSDNVSTALPTVFTDITNNDISIEAWIYPEGNSFSRVVFAQQNASNFMTLSLAGGNVVYLYVNNTTSATTSAGIPANQWTHVACTWDASTQEILIYFNGVLQPTVGGGTSTTGTDNLMMIGSRTNNAQYFPGRLDELRIWDILLSPCQIQARMSSEFSTTQPNLVAYYNFNEGVAGGTNTTITSLPDLTTNYDGTLNTFALSGATSNWIASGAGITQIDQTSNVVNGTDVQSSCSPLLWIDGNTYASSNNTATFLIAGGSVNGCDSLVTLDFTLNTAATGTDVQTSCGSYLWLDGNTYNANNNTATYTYANGAANGCDSIVTLDLTVNTAATGTDVQASCGSYIWIDGNTYNTDNNTATYTYANGAANGCDSIVTLDLTVNTAATGTDVQTSCGAYLWIDGNTYSANNNTATYTYANGAANGCDSIVTLDLTINSVTLGTSVNGFTITADAVGASYQWLDCNDNFAQINGETAANFTPTLNGSYAVQITENGCTDTSACVVISTIGILENSFGTTINAYPNPTSGPLTIQFAETQERIAAKLLNVAGEIVQSELLLDASSVEMSLNQPAGIYLLELTSATGNKAVLRIVKK